MAQYLRTIQRLLQPIISPVMVCRGLAAYPRYVRDLFEYRRLSKADKNTQFALYPQLHDRTSVTSFDAHYTYLGAWALRRINQNRPVRHVDVGAQIAWVACVAGVVDTTFIDIRPFTGRIPGLDSLSGSVLALPFASMSLESLSCLHVGEHIGLGRYGDPLDPEGTHRAIKELSRVLAPGGRLYFAVPIGRAAVMFNAHRVLDPRSIVSRFEAEGLTLVQFSAVDDAGSYLEQARPADYSGASYACGMFAFARK